MDQRRMFVEDVVYGKMSKRSACRKYSISRPTGDKWLERYVDEGKAGLVDRSHAPMTIPHKTGAQTEEAVVMLRRRYPAFGPKKLVAVLRRNFPDAECPAPSTVGAILKRRGLVKPRSRTRTKVPPSVSPLSTPSAPNDVWGIDYKGQFTLGDGQDCYPLTITDLASRRLLACVGYHRIDGESVRQVLEGLFQTFGQPLAMRSDNGSPFASSGVLGLSTLSSWWMSFGVAHERIEPGKPQQNGSHERFHLTLKQETTRPAGADLEAQQARFDRFISYFNEERPHEALGQRFPAEVWGPSERQPIPVTYYDCDLSIRVKKQGHFIFGGKSIYVGTALAGRDVGLLELEPDVWLARFAGHDLGLFEPGDNRVSPFKSGAKSGAVRLGAERETQLQQATNEGREPAQPNV
jgi:putative transposase